MWLTKQRAQPGPVFGSTDNFEGLGIIFDTYKNNRPGVVFPYVMAVSGDGNTAYDKDNDGKANELAGCSVRFPRRLSLRRLLTLVQYGITNRSRPVAFGTKISPPKPVLLISKSSLLNLTYNTNQKTNGQIVSRFQISKYHQSPTLASQPKQASSQTTTISFTSVLRTYTNTTQGQTVVLLDRQPQERAEQNLISTALGKKRGAGVGSF